MATARYFCENCGVEVARNAKHCANCGSFFTSVRCPKCKHSGMPAEFKDGCPICGYAFKPREMGKGIIQKNVKDSMNIVSLPFWVYIIAISTLIIAVVILISITLR